MFTCLLKPIVTPASAGSSIMPTSSLGWQALTWGMRILYGIGKTGSPAAIYYPNVAECEKQQLSVFFMRFGAFAGGDFSFLKIKYPDLKVAGFYSPPFRKLTEAEDRE